MTTVNNIFDDLLFDDAAIIIFKSSYDCGDCEDPILEIKFDGCDCGDCA